MSEFMVRLAIMCGLPLSGKTTYARALRHENPWVVVCPDEIRLALHGLDFYGPAEPFVWANTELMVRTLLREEHMVLIDATNTTKKRRKMWLNIAKEFGLELEAFVLTTEPEECKHRANMSNKPKMRDVIDRMAMQWEPVLEEEIQVVNVGALQTEEGGEG